MNQELVTNLQLIGLNQEEAGMYLACLELGPSSVWDIHLKSGMKRSTCYLIMDELVRRGFASKTNDGRRTIFTVISPKEMAAGFERKQEQFLRSISQLEALSSKSSQKPVVRFYEGSEGIKQIYNLAITMPRGSEQLLVGINMRTPEYYAEFVEEFIAARKRKGIKTRAIYPDNAENRAFSERDAKEARETRFVPVNDLEPRTQMYLFGDCVAYIAYAEKQPFATLIESPAIAFDERQRFELLWKNAAFGAER